MTEKRIAQRADLNESKRCGREITEHAFGDRVGRETAFGGRMLCHFVGMRGSKPRCRLCAMILLALIYLGNTSGLAVTLVLPQNVAVVEDEAFMGNACFTELIVPEGALIIGARAFADMGLTEVTLPSTLTAIADDAFEGCDIAAAHAPYGSGAFEYGLAKGWYMSAPWSETLNIASYGGVAFKVVNSAADPIAFSRLTYHTICQAPNEEGTNTYKDRCLNFAYYYIHCMVDGEANPTLTGGLSGYIGTPRYRSETYTDLAKMMARLYDLLNTGMPQIMMVEAITHAGSRHFLTVIGYRASVNSPEALMPEDLLQIDTFDGKLESMDPALEPVNTRVLFKQYGSYRIEAVTPR